MDTKTQQSIINILYVFLIISTVLSFVPSIAAQIIAMVTTLAILIAAYICKAQDEEDGLLFNHMTYMIRTIWIGSAFLLAGILIAGIWVFAKGDHTLLTSIANSAAEGAISDWPRIMATIHDYMMVNKALLIAASVPTIGPAILYFVYRLANGWARSCKGYRIANPESWL